MRGFRPVFLANVCTCANTYIRHVFYSIQLRLSVLAFLLLAGSSPLMGQPQGNGPGPVPFILDSVEITTADLYEGIKRTPIVSDVLEFFHVVTKENAVRQELFIGPGDTIRQQDLDQLEENLRQLTIFSMIELTVKPLEGEEDEEIPHARLVIRTRDAVSLRGGASYTQSEDSRDFYLGLKEYNLFGKAKQFGASLYYTTLDDLGLKYSTSYLNPNLFGTHAHFSAEMDYSKRQRDGLFYLGRTFISDRTPYAFNTYASFFNGDHIFNLDTPDGPSSTVDDMRQLDLGGWFSSARNNKGNVFTLTGALTYNRTTHHTLTDLHRAFENSVGAFLGIGSRRRTYTKILNGDFHGIQQVPIGGMGSVTLGKISPVAGGLDNVVYVGGDAKQAWRSDDLYAFASMEAGTGLAGKEARFTTQRAVATGLWLLNPGAIAARFEESTVWNWPRYLFLPLDNGTYLRGYPRLQNFGDNRMIFNLEYRFNPIFRLILFDIGGVAFYDIGTTWRQAEKLSQAQFRSSAGIGIRVSNADAKISKGILRVDLAYNFHDRRIAQLIIGIQEAFDVFGRLDFRPPGPYVY